MMRENTLLVANEENDACYTHKQRQHAKVKRTRPVTEDTILGQVMWR